MEKRRHVQRESVGVPSFLQSALWSVDVRTLNVKKNRRYIIEQILNHGIWRQLKWLLKVYSFRDIRFFVLHPSRGIWHKDTLVFWETIFKVRAPYMTRLRALFTLKPTYYPLPRAKKKKK